MLFPTNIIGYSGGTSSMGAFGSPIYCSGSSSRPLLRRVHDPNNTAMIKMPCSSWSAYHTVPIARCAFQSPLKMCPKNVIKKLVMRRRGRSVYCYYIIFKIIMLLLLCILFIIIIDINYDNPSSFIPSS